MENKDYLGGYEIIKSIFADGGAIKEQFESFVKHAEVKLAEYSPEFINSRKGYSDYKVVLFHYNTLKGSYDAALEVLKELEND